MSVSGDFTHGTPGAYTNRRCRCDACKAVWAAYMLPRKRALVRARRAKHRCVVCGAEAARWPDGRSKSRCAAHGLRDKVLHALRREKEPA